MPRCFLSYSSSYGHLLEPMRRLLEVLEFEVDVFDEPDLSVPPADILQARMVSADAVVVLLGPALQPAHAQMQEAASWPNEECICAVSLKKPLAIILHPHTRLPAVAAHLQTPAVFDFWDPGSFLRSVPHVVKHLMDLKRQFDLPPGNHPFVYTKAVVRNRIQRGSLFLQVYHEVVAREAWDSFHHAINTGLDQTEETTVQLLTNDVEIDAPIGGTLHRPEVVFGQRSPKEIEYLVNVKPGLAAGEKFGYRRQFELQNTFPLTKAELEDRASKSGFPNLYRQDGKLYYGDQFDVLFEMESVTLALHFPWRVKLAGVRALALSYSTNHINRNETQRCNSAEVLQLNENAQDGERIATLAVRRPLINHSYVVLYELAE